MAASPPATAGTNGAERSPGTNGIYDLNAAQLRPLPLAAEEAEAVRTAFGAGASHVLVRDDGDGSGRQGAAIG